MVSRVYRVERIESWVCTKDSATLVSQGDDYTSATVFSLNLFLLVAAKLKTIMHPDTHFMSMMENIMGY